MSRNVYSKIVVKYGTPNPNCHKISVHTYIFSIVCNCQLVLVVELCSRNTIISTIYSESHSYTLGQNVSR